MAVDILPTALPREASVHFSNVLMPYLKTVLREYRQPDAGSNVNAGVRSMSIDADQQKAHDALKRATVAQGGVLQESHRWLEGPLGVWREQNAASAALRSARKKRVLMLGSGMVAGPAINEIVRRGDVELIVG